VSFSNELAAIESQARITEQHVIFRNQLAAFSRFMAGDADLQVRRDRFLELVGNAVDFANVCEKAVGDANLLGATRNEAWAKINAETSLNALETILNGHQMMEVLGESLGLPEEVFRPSTTAYAGTQRHASIFYPDHVDELRRKFETAGLPVVGFDEEMPRSAQRLEVAELQLELRVMLRDVRQRAISAPSQGISARRLDTQMSSIDVEGTRRMAGNPHLLQRWEECVSSRVPDTDGGDIPVAAIVDELEERVVVLDLLDRDIASHDAAVIVAPGEYFHIRARHDGEAPSIANDLTRAQLLQLVRPLKSGKPVRIDGRAVDAEHPHLKISRTAYDLAHFKQELAQYRKRTGDIDFSSDARELPLDKGTDVTADFLGATAPKRATQKEGDQVANTHNTIVRLAGFLGLVSIAAGIVAIVFRATGSTKFSFVGVRLDTSSVGVGCIGVGFLICWLSWRSVLRSIKELEEIRSGAPKKRKSKT
jgi:hypothetical protein